MARPASRIAALALAMVVLLMAGAPSAAAKKGSHGRQRKELRLEERSGKKGSRGHHGVQKPKKNGSHGHRKQASGRKRPGRPQSHRKASGRPAGEEDRAPAGSPPRLVIGTHDRIDVPEPRARRAHGPASPRRPRPIHAWHPKTIRAAAAETGRALAFPMALSLLALGFILGHGRMDARDPKLARAPVNEAERLVAFE
jgi:hypothetical protein